METDVLDRPSNEMREVVTEIIHDPRQWGCILCSDCGGVCSFGFLMAYPPIRMIAAIRADTFRRVIAADSVRMCIACAACTSTCPSHPLLTANLLSYVKKAMILSGNVPAELQVALENSRRYDNLYSQ